MINDILYCLLGYTGGVFVETQKGFEISNTVTTLTESEKESLQCICVLGEKYKILNDFNKGYESMFNNELLKTDLLKNDSTKELHTTYLSGISHYMKELLSKYQSEVENLDTRFYSEQNLTINDIMSVLSTYQIKFEKLHELLQNIYQNNLKGANLLNHIYEQGITGDPNIKDLYKMLFINCNVILNNMISVWIINNTIPNNEFFIMSMNHFIVKENMKDGKQISGGANSYTYNGEDLESWHANYYIERRNLPCYFPLNLAEDILFVGKAIKILNSNKNVDECKISINDMSIFYNSLQKLNQIIFRQNEEMNNLLDVELYSKIITLIKNCVSKFLWKLVVNKNGFINHLNGIRNIFLTFHGEFYYNFICKIQDILNLPNFNKKIENEINDVYFQNSLKEVFHIDTDKENYKVYSGFKIKLISSGFNYNFQNEENVINYSKREILFLGGLNYDTASSCLRLINTTYKSLNGALWGLSTFDLDEEFIMNSTFCLKNFTKKENENVISKNAIENSIMKRRRAPSNDKKFISLNYIIHIAKNFPIQPPLNLSDLANYFNFQFNLLYEDDDPAVLTGIKFRLYLVNNLKPILLNINETKTKNLSKSTYVQVNDNEIEIYSASFTRDKKMPNLNEIFDTEKKATNSISIMFKENYCTIFNENKKMNFSFPFDVNQFIPKDKRKIYVGMIISSNGLDMIYEKIGWSFNFYSGEIYNENSNLILINYNPPWPHNFIFNENILKMYNNIFNLVFPLKTSLTVLNQLWVEKKNVCNSFIDLFKIVDSVHAEFTCFLQNLISFYMFDVIELKCKQFYEKISKCNDLEDLMRIHEEFLGEVIINSFVKSKKIMRTIFEILFVVRKYCNYVQNMLVNLKGHKVLGDDGNVFIMENGEQSKEELLGIKEEFKIKVKNLIHCFSGIKNTKHFNIVSRLLAKIEYN